MSTQKFVVSHLDEQLGPFDENELKAKWSRGEILPIDYVYDEGKQDWVLLTERFNWATEPAAPQKAAPILKIEDVELPEETAKIDLSEASEFAEVTGSFSFDNPAPLADVTAAAPMSAVDDAVLAPLATATLAAPAPVAPAPAVPAPAVPPPAHLASAAQTADSTTEPAAMAPPAAPTQLKLVNGVGEVDLASLKPGQIELSVRDSQSGRIRNVNPHAITVRAAEPNEILWHWPEQMTVGQTLEIHVKALDVAGNVCLGYDESFTLEIRGDEHADLLVQFKDGQASHVFKHTKAGNWHVSLDYGGKKRLQLPQKRTLEWLAGPAAKLVIEGPHEYTAGQTLKVQVRAVDEFGNVAKHYQGTVALEVKAS